jgi:hypothetical protein
VGHAEAAAAEGCATNLRVSDRLTVPARLEVKTKTSKFALRISRFLIFEVFAAAHFFSLKARVDLHWLLHKCNPF